MAAAGGADSKLGNYDPYFSESLLQYVPIVALLEAARAMHGVEFLHGVTEKFDFFLASDFVYS